MRRTEQESCTLTGLSVGDWCQPAHAIIATTLHLPSDWHGLVTNQPNCLIRCNTYGVYPQLGWVDRSAVWEPEMRGTVFSSPRCLDTIHIYRNMELNQTNQKKKQKESNAA